MKQKRNWLAMLVAVTVGTGAGVIWYGLLFQAVWMEGNGIVKDGTRYLKHGVEMHMTTTPMLVNMALMVAYAFMVDWFLRKTNAQSWRDGLVMGGMLGLVQVSGLVIVNVFAHDPVSLSLVDGSFALLLFAMYGVVLGAWKKGAVDAV